MSIPTAPAKEIQLTVIVPTYNMEAYLRQCLQTASSISNIASLEIIVVNDGSTDGSLAIACEFEAMYPDSVTVIDKPNGNYGSCVNAGLAVAKGRYVKVLDADDYVDTEALDALVSELPNTDADLLLCPYNDICNDGTKTLKRKGIEKEGEMSLHTLANFRKIPIFHARIFYRTELLRSMGYHQLERSFYTDLEWAILPLATVKSIRIFRHVVYQYRKGRPGQSVTTATRIAHYADEVDVRLDIIKRISYLNFYSDHNRKVCINSCYRIVRQIYREVLVRHLCDKVDEVRRLEAGLSPELYSRISKDHICGFIPYVRCWRAGILWPIKVGVAMRRSVQWLFHNR